MTTTYQETLLLVIVLIAFAGFLARALETLRGDVSRLENRILEVEVKLEKLTREVRRGGTFTDDRAFEYSLTSAAADTAISEVEDLLRSNQKIAAIKKYREFTGLGLKESKEAVEDIERRMR